MSLSNSLSDPTAVEYSSSAHRDGVWWFGWQRWINCNLESTPRPHHAFIFRPPLESGPTRTRLKDPLLHLTLRILHLEPQLHAFFVFLRELFRGSSFFCPPYPFFVSHKPSTHPHHLPQPTLDLTFPRPINRRVPGHHHHLLSKEHLALAPSTATVSYLDAASSRLLNRRGEISVWDKRRIFN